MRQTNHKNQIWFEQQDQVTRIGFTQDFLNSLDQCWHILPAHLEKFREKSPLLTIETNDALISIVSPVRGHFMEFSHKAQNFPNKLTEQDVVMHLRATPVERPVGAPQVIEAPRRAMVNNGEAVARIREQIRQAQAQLDDRAGRVGAVGERGFLAHQWIVDEAPQVVIAQDNNGEF